MNQVVRVEPIALVPTSAGCAVFLGDGKKVIVFYIDPAIGASINAVLSGVEPPRPLTHDLFALTLDSFGAKVRKVALIRQEGEVFFSRLILEAENEIMERKVVDLDARPSDCIALAVRHDAPIYVDATLWAGLDNVSEMLEDLRNQEDSPGGFGL